MDGQYRLCRRLGGPQGRSGLVRKITPPTGIRSADRPGRHMVAISTELSQKVYLTGKGKSVTLQAWSGPEGSRKLRFPDFMTTAQGGGKVVSHTHWPHLPPGNPPGTHFR